MATLKTHIEFEQAFGEVPVEVEYDLEPGQEESHTDPSFPPEVVITGGRMFASGRWIDLDAEQAGNLHRNIDERCMDHASDAAVDDLDARADHDYELQKDREINEDCS